LHFVGVAICYEFSSSEETRLRLSTLIGFGDSSAYTTQMKDYKEVGKEFAINPTF
jgi:hypothetical protein